MQIANMLILFEADVIVQDYRAAISVLHFYQGILIFHKMKLSYAAGA
jgi:hypothetical protein